jgi:hypothetical protein
MWLELLVVASLSLRSYLRFKHKTVIIRKYSKAVSYWLQGMDFFAQIRHICLHSMQRKQSFSQSPPQKAPHSGPFAAYCTMVAAASNPSEKRAK